MPAGVTYANVGDTTCSTGAVDVGPVALTVAPELAFAWPGPTPNPLSLVLPSHDLTYGGVEALQAGDQPTGDGWAVPFGDDVAAPTAIGRSRSVYSFYSIPGELVPDCAIPNGVQIGGSVQFDWTVVDNPVSPAGGGTFDVSLFLMTSTGTVLAANNASISAPVGLSGVNGVAVPATAIAPGDLDGAILAVVVEVEDGFAPRGEWFQAVLRNLRISLNYDTSGCPDPEAVQTVSLCQHVSVQPACWDDGVSGPQTVWSRLRTYADGTTDVDYVDASGSALPHVGVVTPGPCQAAQELPIVDCDTCAISQDERAVPFDDASVDISLNTVGPGVWQVQISDPTGTGVVLDPLNPPTFVGAVPSCFVGAPLVGATTYSVLDITLSAVPPGGGPRQEFTLTIPQWAVVGGGFGGPTWTAIVNSAASAPCDLVDIEKLAELMGQTLDQTMFQGIHGSSPGTVNYAVSSVRCRTLDIAATRQALLVTSCEPSADLVTCATEQGGTFQVGALVAGPQPPSGATSIELHKEPHPLGGHLWTLTMEFFNSTDATVLVNPLPPFTDKSDFSWQILIDRPPFPTWILDIWGGHLDADPVEVSPGVVVLRIDPWSLGGRVEPEVVSYARDAGALLESVLLEILDTVGGGDTGTLSWDPTLAPFNIGFGSHQINRFGTILQPGVFVERHAQLVSLCGIEPVSCATTDPSCELVVDTSKNLAGPAGTVTPSVSPAGGLAPGSSWTYLIDFIVPPVADRAEECLTASDSVFWLNGSIGGTPVTFNFPTNWISGVSLPTPNTVQFTITRPADPSTGPCLDLEDAIWAATEAWLEDAEVLAGFAPTWNFDPGVMTQRCDAIVQKDDIVERLSLPVTVCGPVEVTFASQDAPGTGQPGSVSHSTVVINSPGTSVFNGAGQSLRSVTVRVLAGAPEVDGAFIPSGITLEYGIDHVGDVLDPVVVTTLTGDIVVVNETYGP